MMKNCILAGLFAILIPNLTEAGGTWAPLASSPPVGVNNCLLLSDGTVLGMNGAGQCVKLTPDIHGSYINGAWTTLMTMNSSRLFFASDVLTNGNVFVAGGEYGDANHNDAELYNSLADTWTVVPGSQSPNFNYSDSPSEVLPDGNVLVSDSQSTYYFYNVASNIMIHGGPCGDMNEVCWVKLGNGSIFAIDNYGNSAEHFVSSAVGWIQDASSTPSGAQGGDDANYLLPNGVVFHVGSTVNTAFYTPGATATDAGTLVNGPNLPLAGTNQLVAGESPGAMLVSGKILLELAPNGGGASGGSPCYFYEYDYLSNTFTQVSAPGGGSTFNSSPFVNSMLVLPDGSVLLVGGQNSGSLYIYTPDGTPLAAGQPVISSISQNPDGSFHLTGKGLNGISEGAMFGDDEQMACNYPLVRLTNNVSGNVYYARTYNWNSTILQNTNSVTTEFFLPQNMPPGTYALVVTAVGNASVPQVFVYSPPPVPTGLTAASGSNAFVNLQWNPSVGATAYNVKRSSTSTGYFATIATVGGTNYSDTGLVNGKTYYYKVAAIGSSGPSSDSASVSAAPNGPPPIPTGLTAVADIFERVDLTWTASYGATNYNIRRSTTHNGPYTNAASSVNPFYTETGLVSGTTYYYVVSAVSGGGESSNSIEAGVTAQAIGNFGFETPNLGSGDFQYGLPGGVWTFNGSPGSGSGILANGSAFSNPSAPEGVQAAFLQGHGVISQVLSGFAPGTNYTITYSAAQRPGYSQSWNVMIDGTVIRSNNPGGTSYATYTASFVATAVTHTLFFVGTDLANNQDTVFLDNVRINPPLTSTVPLPVVTQDTLPATAATVVGDSITFTAAFSNAPAAIYQWQFISGGVIADIPGATNSILTLTNLQLSRSGFYRLKAVNATNSQGVVFSATSPLSVSNVPGAVNNVVASYAAQTGLGRVRTNFAPTWTVSPGSVISGQTPSSVGSGNFSLNGVGAVAVLTDGVAGSLNFWPNVGSSTTEVTCGSGAGQSITYSLIGSPSGYTLTNIVVYGGWGDAGRDQQAYTVYYATAAAPTTFIQLSVVNYNPVNAAAVQSATRATLSAAAGVLASNVAAVKFDFTTPAGENGYSGYSEIALYGAPQTPVVLTNTLPATAADVVGSQVTFRAAINGVNLVYQWQKISGGVTNNIAGATNTTLTLTNLHLTDTASYQLGASNAYGVAVSAPGALTVSSVPAPVANVITELAAQTGLGPSGTLGLSFTPTWTVTTNNSLIAGQSPSTALGNFSEEIPGRSISSLTAGGDQSLTIVNGTSGHTTSTNYVTCGNGGGAGSSLIYTLTGSASGYNLTNIMVYGGWGDAGRDQQAYTVYYSKVGAPTTYIQLGSVNYNPANGANVQSATRATLVPASGALATNVAAVKFDFTSPPSENGYVGYSQINLFGVPTPQPVRWAVGNGNWDTNTSNWKLLSGGGAVKYIENNLAAFDDSASGNNPITVTLTGDRSPSVVTNNSSKNYILAGNYSVTSGSLIKDGSGTLLLDNGGANAFFSVLINNGTLQVGNGDTGGGLGQGHVTNNGALAFNRTDSVAFNNVILGSGSLAQNGSGTSGLSGVNTYTGTTTVNAGTLALLGPGSINGSAVIVVANGATLDVSGRADQTLTLNNGQTLQGSGYVKGGLSAQNGSTINPGDTIGMLTVEGSVALNGLLVLEVNRTNGPTADELASVAGTIAGGGTLTVTNLGPDLQAGDTFALFNQPVAGFVTVSLPLVGSGIGWANNLGHNGTVAVVSTAPPPLAIQPSRPNMLTLNWPSDHIGWRLQMQTNGMSAGLGTNWVDVANSTTTNQMTISVNTGIGSVFYRLVYP